jgi:very-short-patch-repair endonuclease
MRTPMSDAFPARRQHLGRRRHLAAAGIGAQALADALARGDLLRIRRGVYAPNQLPERARHLVSGGSPDPAYVAHVRAALMSLGPTAVAGGRTAAVLWGFDMLVEPQLIEVVVPTSREGAPSGVALRRRRGSAAVEHAVLGLEPLRLLAPVTTVVDCALNRPLREAVVIADSALRAGAVTLDGLRELSGSLVHHPRGHRLRRVLDLADPSAASVLESLARLLFLQHGLSPEAQVSLRDARGRFIGRVDFLFRDQRLVIECDGRRWHDPEDARARDRVRDNELERAGFRLLRLTWNDIVHRPQYVIALVRDCLEPSPVAA